MEKSNRNAESLVAVHTHTHTHTGSVSGYLTYKKIKIDNVNTLISIFFAIVKSIDIGVFLLCV